MDVRAAAAVTVVGYVRVSTEEQGRSGLGLEAQREAILAAHPAAQVMEEVASGKRADNRDVLQGVLSSLRKGDTLVVAKLDRLTRSLLDFADLVQVARRRGWDLVALDQGFDLSTPNGRAMAGILAVFAEWEREIIGARISAAMRTKVAQGWCPPQHQPKIPKQVRARIRRLNRQGLSQRKIAEVLNGEGVPAVGTRWHKETVARVLRAA